MVVTCRYAASNLGIIELDKNAASHGGQLNFEWWPWAIQSGCTVLISIIRNFKISNAAKYVSATKTTQIFCSLENIWLFSLKAIGVP